MSESEIEIPVAKAARTTMGTSETGERCIIQHFTTDTGGDITVAIPLSWGLSWAKSTAARAELDPHWAEIQTFAAEMAAAPEVPGVIRMGGAS